MVTRRRVVLALGAGALAAPLAAFAQQSAKIYRIGFLGAASASGYASQVEALRAGLRDLGYVEGKNIVIEFRWAEGKYERLPDLAAELASLNVDVIVCHATPGILAAKRATAKIPIVMAVAADAPAAGLVESLARPGGNITGSTWFSPEIAGKRIELLKEAVPRITRVAVLVNPDNASTPLLIKAMEVTAKSLKVQLLQLAVRSPGEFKQAFSSATQKHIDAVVISDEPTLIANAKAIANITTKKRLPSIGFGDFAEAGCIMGYGANLLDLYRRAAYFVDKILKGVKPADIPVEQPTKFELVVNMKTAKALGIKIPNSVLLRADKVIE